MAGMFGDRSRVVILSGNQEAPAQAETPPQDQIVVEQERQQFADILEALAKQDAQKLTMIRDSLGITQAQPSTQMGEIAPVTGQPDTQAPAPIQVPMPRPEQAENTPPGPPKMDPMRQETPTPVSIPKNVNEDTSFLAEVDRVASKFGVQPSDLMRVIKFETAGSFDPAQKSGTSSAIGLIQFMPEVAEELGTSSKALAGMTRTEQMAYVDKYLSRYEDRINNFDDLYMAIHWPRAAGKSSDYVLYNKDSDAYAANKGLDIDKDGSVTKREATRRARGIE